ncbi:MAG: hypothetical protein ACRD5M_15825 [Candidatus Acidiferrales bacterium]
MNRRIAILFSLLLAAPCLAHVGSPDVYFQGDAGPYQLAVTIRTPQMIPGVAEIEIRSSTPGVHQLKIVPLYIVGTGSKYPPPPDVLLPSKDDPQYFTGKLWLMASGSWQVRIEADGEDGAGTLAVPVPAFARNTLPMQKDLGALLTGLMILLVLAIASILGAARREGQLEPGQPSGQAQKRGARFVMTVALMIVIGLLSLGGWWWKVAASARAQQMIYKPPELFASLLPGDKLLLRVGESAWHTRRPEAVSTKLIPDHGHLMHLFLIRAPQMDRFYHLHPAEDKGGVFLDNLPPIPAGHYQIFADIVRESGFPDTLVAELDIPDMAGRPLAGDDSATSAPALTQNAAGNVVAPLSDGARMVWEREPGPLPANQLIWFRFHVEDAAGKRATDLEPYMGMAGHAEFVRSDLSVFAHVHPDGSASMAAIALADASLPANTRNPSAAPNSTAADSMPGMQTSGMKPRTTFSSVAFPYGFPKSGLYRIFVQVKRAGRVETGVFDAWVK